MTAAWMSCSRRRSSATITVSVAMPLSTAISTARGFRGPDEPSDQLTRHVLEARLGPAGPVEGLAGPVGGGLQTAQRLVHLRVRDLRQVPLPGDVEQFGPAVLTGEVGEVEVACDD